VSDTLKVAPAAAKTTPDEVEYVLAIAGHVDPETIRDLERMVASAIAEGRRRFVLDLLQNAESNAEVQGLDVESLVVSHIQANMAPKLRRRTYRAHGRINAYMSSPSHIELILSAKPEPVARAAETKGKVAKKRGSARLVQGASA